MAEPSYSLCAATAQAHPNIALIKYWGKRDADLNTPAVDSLSITLSDLRSRTRIAFDSSPGPDQVFLDGERASPVESARVSALLDLMRARAGRGGAARVDSDNDFPTAAGLASSASGFAALVCAADAALHTQFDSATLSELARRGSGSAARSIFGGFVRMHRGQRDDGSDAIAEPLLEAPDWPLRVVIAITSSRRKSDSSTRGMNLTAQTSPYYPAWVEGNGADVALAAQAVADRDFEALAELSELSCLKMHGLMLSARPGLVYWNGATVEALHTVRALRSGGQAVFFTIDAGPQVKAVCTQASESAVADALTSIAGVERVVRCGLGGGATALAG